MIRTTGDNSQWGNQLTTHVDLEMAVNIASVCACACAVFVNCDNVLTLVICSRNQVPRVQTQFQNSLTGFQIRVIDTRYPFCTNY